MEEALSIIGALSGVIAIVLVLIFKKSAQKYVDAKAKNLATIEDTGRITKEIESVKNQYQQKSHAWKWIFEKEYEILERVWKSTWEFQSSARCLRPILDRLPKEKEEQMLEYQRRYTSYVAAVNGFGDIILKNQPFIPPVVYEICLELRKDVISLEVDFECTQKHGLEPDWKEILDSNNKLDQKLDRLNQAIREHVYGIIDNKV
jgi:hypothetical protein